jgi:gliding motility-associated-like protein
MDLIRKVKCNFLSGKFCRRALLCLLLPMAMHCQAQAPDISYTTPNVYNINTPITPLTPTNNGTPVPANVYGQVSTFAILAPALVPNGTGSFAFFSTPNALNFDAAGNLYVADINTKQIRKITPAGDVTTFAGIPGVSGSLDGPAALATFGAPTGVVVDSQGNVFVADNTGNTIRKITTVGTVSTVTTFAGSSTIGSADGVGILAQFNKPYGLAIDANDNIYVTDQGNNTIRKITPAGDVTTFAGSPTAFGKLDGQGTAASFRGPTYITVNALGSVYVVDAVNNLIRAITPARQVSTLSIINLSTTGAVNGLRVDAAGNLYFVSQRNGVFILTNTNLMSLAGNLSGATGSADGVGAAAFFNKPADLVFDNAGNLYIADQNNNRIRKLSLTGYTIDKALPTGLSFDATTGIISGTPTVAFQPVTYTITAYNKSGSGSTTVDISVIGLPAPPKIVAPNISYTSPVTYNPGVPITPLQPTNTGGAVPATIYGETSDFASGFNYSWGVATDAFGTIYACDFGNNQIKKIDPITHNVTVFAGSPGGAQGYNNGPANTALLWSPSGIALDAFGNVYVSDQGSNTIRKITPGGVVSTLAGSGAAGDQVGIGSDARFNTPRGLAIDANDNLYVADFGNNVVKKIDTKTGLVSYVYDAGPLKSPSGVGIDASGVLYIADADNNRIQKVANGAVTTLSIPAGTLKSPREVRIDGTGNVYITDQLNHRVLRISPTNVVTPITYFSTTQTIIGAVLDGLGNLYIGDNAYSVVKIVVSGYEIDKPLPAGLSFDQKTGTITGTPTAPSPLQPYVITAYNGGGSNSFTLNLEVANTSATTITFGNPVLKTNPDNTVTVSATSNNTEAPIQYTSSNPAVISVDANNVLHRVGPGTVTITASQVATAHYFAGTATHTETLKLTQQIIFPAIAAKTICSADFLSGATSATAASFPITYVSSNTAVATINTSGIIHLVGIGTTTITASEAGDANFYDDATPQAQTLTVTSGLQPLVSVAPNTTTTCAGSPITFTATVSNLGSLTNPTYQWQVNGTPVGTNSATYTTSSAASADFIKCTVTNNAVCPANNSDTYTGLTIMPVTALTVSIQSSAKGAVCSGSAITFTATPNFSGPNVIYQWHYLNGTNVGTNSNTYTSSTFNNGDIITCTITNNSVPCLTSNSANSNALTVNIITPASPIPSVSIIASANNVYEGTAITFTATTLNTVDTVTYQWQVNGKNAGPNSPTFTSSTFLNGDKVTCSILSGGCAAPATSAAVALIILPPLKIIPSTAFTPNGDGVNDLWTITGLFSYPNCLVNVYSRSGQLVYQSRGYTKPWDGIYNGRNLPVGTYYYVIDLNSNKPKVSGYIAIIR